MQDQVSNQQPSPEQARPARAWLRNNTLRLIARVMGWCTLAVLVLVASAAATVHFWILPRIDSFRPQLEERASAALGLTVKIEEIVLVRAGWRPTIALQHIRFIDGSAQEGLHVDKVEAQASLFSLATGRLAHLAIINPALQAQRKADSRIYIAGIALPQKTNAANQSNDQDIHDVLDILLKQPRLEIRNGSVRWHDALRNVPPLTLTGIQARLKNGKLHHTLELAAKPPPEWGQPVTATAQWQHGVFQQRSDWDHWKGSLQTSLTDVDISRLHAYVDLGKHVSLKQGHGNLAVQVNFHNTFRDIALNVQLHTLQTTLGKNLPPLALKDLQSLFHIQFDKKSGRNSYTLVTKNLSFTTDNGLQWKGGNVNINYQDADNPAERKGSLQGNAWNIGIIGQIASSLPLGDAVNKALQRYQPQGQVGELHVSWQGDINAPSAYTARGHANGISWQSQPGQADPNRKRKSPPIGIPGVAGANIHFDLNQSGGKMNLQLNKGSAEFPGVFENPRLAFDTFQTQVDWRIQNGQINVTLPRLRFRNDDVEGEVSIDWHTYNQATGAERFPGVMDLKGRIVKARAERVVRYLPLSIGREALDYIGHAVRSGDIHNARVHIQGDLDLVPFGKNAQGVQPAGTFRFDVPLRNAEFAFVPRYLQKPSEKPWPTLQQLNGTLVFDKDSLSVLNATGRFSTSADVAIHNLAAHIPKLGDDLVVGLAAQLRGPLDQTLQVTNQSPLSDLLGNSLEKTTATGVADMSLALGLPVMRMHDAQVKGSVQLNNNDIRMSPESPLLTKSQGQIAFNERGFTLQKVSAQVMGGPAVLEGGTTATKPGQKMEVLIRAKGDFTGEGLHQETALGSISRLGQFLHGRSAYNATIQVRNGVLELTIDSDLTGMGMRMPYPLAKTPGEKLPFHYSTRAIAPSGGHKQGHITEDEMQIRFGDRIYAQYIRDISQTSAAKVLRGRVAIGSLAVNDPPPMPTEGVHALVQIEKLDADGWTQILDATWGLQEAPGHPERKLLLASAESTAVSNLYLPDQVVLRTPLLTFYNRNIELLVADGVRKGRLWSFSVTARQINGKVEYLQSAANGPGSIKARLSQLIIGPENVEEVSNYVQKTANPQTLPYLDIDAREVELLGYNLDHIVLRASNHAKPRPADAALEDETVIASAQNAWYIHELKASLPHGNLKGSGVWAIAGSGAGNHSTLQPHDLAKRFVSLHLQMETDNFGDVLTHLGQTGLATGGTGHMAGTIRWSGSPAVPDLETLDGNLKVEMRNGNITKIDPGAAKLISLLSVQGLSRLGQMGQGLSFDSINGSLQIDKGIAKTSNLVINGFLANIKVNGQANLINNTLNLDVVAQPKVDLSTAAVVATAINPLVGLGSYFAQLALSKSISNATTQVLKVKGTFKDPAVQKLQGQEAQQVARRILKNHVSQKPLNEWWNWSPVTQPTPEESATTPASTASQPNTEADTATNTPLAADSKAAPAEATNASGTPQPEEQAATQPTQ